jgi:hypothetical protein
MEWLSLEGIGDKKEYHLATLLRIPNLHYLQQGSSSLVNGPQRVEVEGWGP